MKAKLFRTAATVLALTLAVSMTACGGTKKTAKKTSSKESASSKQVESVEETPSEEEPSSEEPSSEESSAQQPSSQAPAAPSQTPAGQNAGSPSNDLSKYMDGYHYDSMQDALDALGDMYGSPSWSDLQVRPEKQPTPDGQSKTVKLPDLTEEELDIVAFIALKTIVYFRDQYLYNQPVLNATDELRAAAKDILPGMTQDEFRNDSRLHSALATYSDFAWNAEEMTVYQYYKSQEHPGTEYTPFYCLIRDYPDGEIDLGQLGEMYGEIMWSIYRDYYTIPGMTRTGFGAKIVDGRLYICIILALP